MAEVLYLCDDLINSGLVFAKELPEKIYSPGKLYISSQVKNEKIVIKAMDGEIEKELHLEHIKNNIYTCSTERYGKITFIKENTKYIYTGNININEEIPLNVIKPLNVKHLEKLCKNNDFYFVGKLFNE